MGLQRHLQIFSRQFYTQILLFAIKIPRHYQILILRRQEYNDWLVIYNPQIEMFAHFKTKSSFHKTKCII